MLRTAVDLNEVAERLRAMGCVAAEEEAVDLVDSARDRDQLDAFLARRSRGEPIAWITGWTRFCGRRILVAPGVYVPRYESEELARRATVALAAGGRRAVDLCTGAGAVASVLGETNARVIGVELDKRAAACARRNGIAVMVSDLGAALRPRTFDVVTAVAPYVPSDQLAYLPADVQRYEPRLALDGGVGGLNVIRRVVTAAARLLKAQGWLFLELGGSQDETLTPVLVSEGFRVVETWGDEDGDLRGLVARLDAAETARLGAAETAQRER